MNVRELFSFVDISVATIGVCIFQVCSPVGDTPSLIHYESLLLQYILMRNEELTMALKLNLAPNESIVLKEACVAHGGVMAIYTDELILTNLNVICISKGMFGNTKNIFYYPLSQLKHYNGKAQAILGKLSNGTYALELYFVNGVETFNFQSNNKKTINKWINSISEIVGCRNTADISTEDDDEVDPDSIAGALKEVADEFRAAFGFKAKKKNPDKNVVSEPTTINRKCISCSAPLVGKKGQVVHCKYCDTDQTL